jgi:hypothetical protein
MVVRSTRSSESLANRPPLEPHPAYGFRWRSRTPQEVGCTAMDTWCVAVPGPLGLRWSVPARVGSATSSRAAARRPGCSDECGKVPPCRRRWGRSGYSGSCLSWSGSVSASGDTRPGAMPGGRSRLCRRGPWRRRAQTVRVRRARPRHRGCRAVAEHRRGRPGGPDRACAPCAATSARACSSDRSGARRAARRRTIQTLEGCRSVIARKAGVHAERVSRTGSPRC